MKLTHFSLFSGIGGIDLAAEWAGFESVGQCEFADYPTRVLEKHWPNVPRWRDIRDVTAESFRERTGRTAVDLISGGFPCQPFSVAGRRKGNEDDRYLWPEMLRVISQIKPTWVLGENVAGIINMALDRVLLDLETEGYACQPFVIPACSVNAKHRRDRVFIVGYSKHNGLLAPEVARSLNKAGNYFEKREKKASKSKGTSRPKSGETLAYSAGEGLEGTEWEEFEGGRIRPSDGSWWDVEPKLGRVANGVPNRVDRIKCLGNAVVPQQAYPILKAIAEIEGLSP